MEKKFLVSIFENEDRMNKLVKVLALSPAKHFQIEYTNDEIEICAYTHQLSDAQQTETMLLFFATKADRIQTIELENSNGKFWVSKLYISI